MSLEFAVVDKATVLVEVDPNTLLVTLAMVGKVMVLLPVPSCVKTTVPYDPTGGAVVKVNSLFCVKIISAFNPCVGSQSMVDPV